MEDITITEGGVVVSEPVNNTIIGTCQGARTKITFKGERNILFIEDNVRLEGCNITFCSSDAVVYLSANTKHPYKIKIDAWRGVSIFFGKDNYFNGVLTSIISERKNLIVGGGGVFSFGIWIRTADPHLLYDLDTKQRINQSRSVMIGDHVWLGQNSLILKGTSIGSGSTLAGGAVISGKKAGSNTVWGGNPAQQIRSNVFFSGASVHNYTEEQTEKSQKFTSDEFIYTDKGHRLTMEQIDQQLYQKNPEERLEVLKQLAANPDKDRFYVPAEKQRKRKGLFR